MFSANNAFKTNKNVMTPAANAHLFDIQTRVEIKAAPAENAENKSSPDIGSIALSYYISL